MSEMTQRIVRAIKEPHELPRRLMKLWFLLNTRGVETVVESAYREPDGADHQRIKQAAAMACGLTESSSLVRSHAKAFLEAVGTAKYNLFQRNLRLDLGAAPIGFGQLKIKCTTVFGPSAHVYLLGCDDVVLFRMLERLVSPGSCAVDVGANVGIHTCVLSECVGERGAIYAYEPVAANVRQLEANLQINERTNVVIREVGVAAEPGSIPFDVKGDADFNSGMSRYDRDAKQRIPVLTLDDDLKEVENIVLIKIDVEGMELEVIKGARQLLAKHRPYLVLEYNQNDWSLLDLAELLPYKHRVFAKPFDLTRKWRPLDGVNNGFLPKTWDILVVPEDKMNVFE